MTSPFDLSGRTALVTGSSRGLGRAMAEGLAVAGASIILNGAHSGRLAESFDTADEDGVVAAGMGGFVGDFETGAAARQQRRPAGAGMPVQSGKTVDRPCGKAVGEIELAGRQNIARKR